MGSSGFGGFGVQGLCRGSVRAICKLCFCRMQHMKGIRVK